MGIIVTATNVLKIITMYQLTNGLMTLAINFKKKPPERSDVECQEEETALCDIGENISHNVTRKRANKHCLTIKYG